MVREASDIVQEVAMRKLLSPSFPPSERGRERERERERDRLLEPLLTKGDWQLLYAEDSAGVARLSPAGVSPLGACSRRLADTWDGVGKQ